MRIRRPRVFAAVITAAAMTLGGCNWITGTIDPAVFDVVGTSALEPNDLFYNASSEYPLQWTLGLIGMPRAWGILNAAGVQYSATRATVAVIDSGVSAGHPDLEGVLVPGYDFNRNEVIVAGVTRTDGSVQHGTHVAGTIAANANNGIGVAGLAWRETAGNSPVAIMPLKVLDYAPSIESSRGGIGELVEAILYAAGIPNDSGVAAERPVDVINMSLGADYDAGISLEEAAVMEAACIAARASGVVLFAAAGNQGASSNNGGIDYPARFDSVIAVGSVNFDRTVSSFSEIGDPVFVVAPGGYYDAANTQTSVLSTSVPSDAGGIGIGYRRLAGTSMATPHAAGAAALVKVIRPDISVAGIEDLIAATADDLGSAGRDEATGWGLLRADRALETAWADLVGQPLPSAVAAPSPSVSRAWAKSVSVGVRGILPAEPPVTAIPEAGTGEIILVIDPTYLADAQSAPELLSDIAEEHGLSFYAEGRQFIRRARLTGPAELFAETLSGLERDSRVLVAASVGGAPIRAAVQ